MIRQQQQQQQNRIRCSLEFMLSSSEINELKDCVSLISNSARPDVYDTVERRYKFDDDCEKFLRGTDVHSEIMLRSTFGRRDYSSEWEVKYVDQKVGRRWKVDDVNLSSDLYGRAKGDVQAAFREIGFRFVNDHITRVFEYSVSMYNASVLIFVPWKYHSFLREEWGLSSKPIYTIRSYPTEEKDMSDDASSSPWSFLSLRSKEEEEKEDTRKRKRQKNANVWNVDIIHPYVKEKDGSDRVLGQGSNEDPKLAHEEAASKARLALLSEEEKKLMREEEEKNKDIVQEEKFLVTIETVVPEPEVQDGCISLHKLQTCIGL